MKKITLILAIFLFGIAAVLAQESHDSEIEEGKGLVESKISCDKLSNEQLEAIGDYYMEQMHPGEAHEIMDNMMGGEGSESLKQFHINMAKTIYCGESGGMMGSGGMIGMMNMMGGGMMGSYPSGYSYANGYWNTFWISLFAAVIFLIAWIIHRFGVKKAASETPLNILRKRFAKGEITKKEFEGMKKEIGG
ncbi:SHOCT domain-containing protein [Candidatus Woesearchaeota archaeon]|nr:SHOCT domain-containing protein [Candidatus Woesearchaeota archaeon]